MNSFAELKLIEPLQRAVADSGYDTPTEIQVQAIPPALALRDVLGSAQTGTGKTAAFTLPILNQFGQSHRKSIPNQPFALILAPTRELAIQIGDSLSNYGRHLRLRHAVVYGGVSQGRQVRAVKRGVHILVATPGRLLDLMGQGHIELSRLDCFVLDEADRMLDMGFLPDLRRIVDALPEQRQSLFFSATLPPRIIALANRLLRDPVEVRVSTEPTNTDCIKQEVVFVEQPAKQTLLRGLLASPDVKRALVFTRTKHRANVVAKRLIKSGIEAAVIHGNKSQRARQQALEAFRSFEVQVLVATDVAARGIDVDGISHVINFDLPAEPEAYVHRIGRTGRAGSEGMAVSFCSSGEKADLRAIEKLIHVKIPVTGQAPEPSGPEPESQRRIIVARPRRSERRDGSHGRTKDPKGDATNSRPRRRRRRRQSGRPQRSVDR